MTDVSLTRLNRSSLDKVNQTLLPIDKTGLVAYYPFWQNSGTTLYDESKNGNDGTINGATWTWDTTRSKPALDFDGTNDDVGLPGGIMNANQNWSILWWFKTSMSTAGIMFYFTDGSYDNYIVSRLNSDGTVRGRTRAVGGNFPSVDTTSTYDDGSWHFAVLKWDDSNENLYLDMDGGSETVSDTTTGLSGEVASLTDWDIGFDNVRNRNYFDGIISNLYIYTRFFSTTEIGRIYSKTKPP